LTPSLGFVIGLVKTGAFKDESGTHAEEAFGFAFLTFWAGLGGGVVHRLKHFPVMSTSLALIVVSRHRLSKKLNFEAVRINQLI